MLAQKIRRGRMLCGKTQEQVCEALHWSQSKYSRFETGEQEPGLNELRVLADCFSISLEDLIGNTPLVVQIQQASDRLPAAEGMNDPNTWNKEEVKEFLHRNELRAAKLIEMLDRQLNLLERMVEPGTGSTMKGEDTAS